MYVLTCGENDGCVEMATALTGKSFETLRVHLHRVYSSPRPVRPIRTLRDGQRFTGHSTVLPPPLVSFQKTMDRHNNL